MQEEIRTARYPSLIGRTVLVTGGAAGIGSAIVEAFLEQGAKVAFIDRDEAAAAMLLARLGDIVPAPFFVPCDLTDIAALRLAVARVAETPESVVLFESPNRTTDTLRDLAEATPERRACVARELTKVYEELVRGSLADLAADPRPWLGEIAIVLGPHDPGDREEHVGDDAIDARIGEALEHGEHARSIAERLAAWSGRPRRELYARVVSKKK